MTTHDQPPHDRLGNLLPSSGSANLQGISGKSTPSLVDMLQAFGATEDDTARKMREAKAYILKFAAELKDKSSNYKLINDQAYFYEIIRGDLEMFFKWLREHLDMAYVRRIEPQVAPFFNQYQNIYSRYHAEAEKLSNTLRGFAENVGRNPDYLKKEQLVQEASEANQQTASSVNVTAQKGNNKMKKTAFIVHGHDEINLLKLKNLLENEFGLNVIVLSDAANSGRTLIQKFEGEAIKADYVFVLWTGDDIIVKDENNRYSQARPNVIFELGWFCGKMGLGKVAVLFQKGTTINTDMDGFARIEFDKSVSEKFLEIQRELKAAGIVKVKIS